ncbi:hypothetical protein RFI_24304 [Reticulomyxa filosa]|uniref:Uncharacterized protein n=1 Tax=Reticulomyxa filosa TaxID=46433 RepID=X6MHC2_RETFI|nr:hypothetical protein RFI_24304 [Reticulomyxa filosa]|eukprot:ETO13071.1 hypothetical protein RFI_24304 [Reticulomyxa filosa]
MEGLQKKHKIQCQSLAKRLHSSPAWNNLLKFQNLNGLYFDILSEHHYWFVLTLLCYQFSMYGNAIDHICFNTSTEENFPLFAHKVKAAIAAGMSWVAVDQKTDLVVGFTMSHDVLVANSFKSAPNPLASPFQQLQKQINSKALQSMPHLSNLIFDENLKLSLQQHLFILFYFFLGIKYGEIGVYGVVTLASEFVDQKLGQLLGLLQLTTYCHLDYRMGFTINASPESHQLTFGGTRTFFPYKLFDFSRLKFPEGNKCKSMDDVYLELHTKHGYTKEYVDYVKRNSQVMITYIIFRGPEWWLGYANVFPYFKHVIQETFPHFTKL